MRKVKTCLFCNFYNDYRLSSCKNCGASLHDVIIEEIDTPDEFATVITKEECEKCNIVENNENFVRICPFCFEENKVGDDICYICNSKISHVSPIKRENRDSIKFKNTSDHIGLEEGTIISKRLILRNSNINLEFILVDKVLIGRKDFLKLSQDICQYISREHLIIEFANGMVTVKDISTNGSSINGAKVEKSKGYTIKTGDQLTIHNVVFDVFIF